ncbi:type IV pilin protein, partial [Akkermansia sp.]
MKVSFATRQLHRGFTLIELLVVIAIIALLASVAYGPIINQINKGDQMQA